MSAKNLEFILIFFRDSDSYRYTIIKEATWAGFGPHEQCTNPKLFWESIVPKLEHLVSFIKFEYYDGSEKEELCSVNEMENISSVDDSIWGRCFKITPTLNMKRKGIRKIKIEFLSLSLVFIHTPGLLKTDTSRAQSFTSLMADLHQDINRVSSFSRCCNGTFP